MFIVHSSSAKREWSRIQRFSTTYDIRDTIYDNDGSKYNNSYL